MHTPRYIKGAASAWLDLAQDAIKNKEEKEAKLALEIARAKLIELEPDGRAMLLMDGVVRAMCRDPSGEPQHLVPDRVERLSIDLGHIYHTFRAGHRIEVDVTSSNFPRRARNTNSGHPILANDGDAEIRVAMNVVHHAERTPSFLELPVAR